MNKQERNQRFFHYNSFIKNCRGQIGETMTWVIATIIIVVILIIAIFITSLLGIVGVSKEYSSVGERQDLIPVKSLTAYLLTENFGKSVFEQLKEDGNLNDFNGNLGLKIFKGFYGKNYKIALAVDNKGNYYFENDVFTQKYDSATGYNFYFTERINLNEDKELKLFWSEK